MDTFRKFISNLETISFKVFLLMGLVCMMWTVYELYLYFRYGIVPDEWNY